MLSFHWSHSTLMDHTVVCCLLYFFQLEVGYWSQNYVYVENVVLHAACLVQRSGWTKDVDIFLEWLSAVPFSGGGFNDAAIAEGLSEALMVWNINLLCDFKCIFVL